MAVAVAPSAPRAALRYPADALLVVAGIPGAGKSTLIRRVLARRGDVTTLDPETIRDRWQRALGTTRGYRLYRPLVHAEHYVRVLAALRRGGPLAIHDTATRGWVRRALAWLAAGSGRSAHLLFLDVAPADAERAQRVRGRRLPRRAMRRHARAWGRLRQRVRRPGATATGYASTTVLDRRAAARLDLVSFA